MKFKYILLTTLFLLLFWGFLEPPKTLANTLYPHTKEVLIGSDERTREILHFRNDTRKKALITPVIYSYDPQTLEISKEDGFIFTRADKEIFPVKPGETLQIEYEIVPFGNMNPGTYFNVIVLEKQPEETFVAETNPVGSVDNIAHLVVMHIVDPGEDVRGITSEFARVGIEILEKGIPFIRPTKLRYTYQNITGYVLNPMGEIQIYNERGKQPPVYLKINSEEKKLYPQGLMEEEFEISNNHIADLYSKRVVIGRFYNGIDENLILKEIIIEPNYVLFASLALSIIATIILLKLIFSKKKKEVKKNTTKKKEATTKKKNPARPS